VQRTGAFALRRALSVALIVALASVSGCASDGAPPASRQPPLPPDADLRERAERAGELPPVRIALPFPADEIERTWVVSDDKTLVFCPCGTDAEYDVTYYLVSVKPVAGAASCPEVQRISPTRIEFLCHGEGGIPFESFPYVTVYDIEAEDWTQRDVWRDPRDTLRFGSAPVEGQELTEISIEDGAVSLRFRTVPEAMPDLGGPFTRIPRTTAQWDAEEKALVLRLHGTRPAERVKAEAGAIEAEGLVAGCSVEAEPEGDTIVRIQLTELALYNASYTFGEPRTMTVRFKAMSEE